MIAAIGAITVCLGFWLLLLSSLLVVHSSFVPVLRSLSSLVRSCRLYSNRRWWLESLCKADGSFRKRRAGPSEEGRQSGRLYSMLRPASRATMAGPSEDQVTLLCAPPCDARHRLRVRSSRSRTISTTALGWVGLLLTKLTVS